MPTIREIFDAQFGDRQFVLKFTQVDAKPIAGPGSYSDMDEAYDRYISSQGCHPAALEIVEHCVSASDT